MIITFLLLTLGALIGIGVLWIIAVILAEMQNYD